MIVAACFMLRSRDRHIDFWRLHCGDDLSTQRFLKCDFHLKKIPKTWRTGQISNEPSCLGGAYQFSKLDLTKEAAFGDVATCYSK